MSAATARLELPARLTLAEARAAAVDWARASLPHRAGDVLVLDAGALGQFDSSALAVLLELQRRLQPQAGIPRRRGAGPAGELAGLYGVAGLLGMAASRLA